MRTRTWNPDSYPVKKITKCRKSFYINYNNNGLIYLVPDVEPPTIHRVTRDDTTIVNASRTPIPNLRMEWFGHILPLGFTKWPIRTK